ncbi:drug transporter [Mycobacterium ulcerans subsp. shinshuense]|uniref:Drug transporter n=2 Tax=Mycobacterium ulcerans TaxID=1809 RepID=A0A1B4Y6F2_MYCUL|nr:drug transporter [Mycobacterium ulcerans subsp. shinshuense]
MMRPRATVAAATPTTDLAAGRALITPRRRNFIFVALVLGILLSSLDQTIVAIALPTIVADLGEAGRQS